MRVLIWTIVGLGAVLGPMPAMAQAYNPRYPVCLKLYGRDGDYNDCRFTSITQCNWAASGRAGQCFVNPYFAGAAQPQRR